MSRPSEEALSRAFAAMRETDRKRAPDFETVLARSPRAGDADGKTPPFAEDDLLRLAPEAVLKSLWQDRRMKSRGFAEPLFEAFVEKSQAMVHNDPAMARAWAVLVPRLLDRAPSHRAEDTWHRRMRVKAAAFEANALRAAGDFHAAAKIFRRLNREFEELPELGSSVRAKVASLEASLCIDDRRFEAADRKLDIATRLYREIGDSTEYACCLIKKANLASTRQRPEEMIGPLEKAAALLDPVRQGGLYICTVTGRINAHCDSGRPREAQKILQAHWKTYMAADSPFHQGIGQCLRGRVFFAQRRYAEAASAFRISLEKALAIGRHYDAAMVCLFLAESYLALGDTAKLRAVAADAFKVFRSRGVARDMLAALRLLSEAAKADEVTLSLVTRLRRDLESSLESSG